MPDSLNRQQVATRDIARAWADAHQRVVSLSEYHLTGFTTCPGCGSTYIGTAAKGRNRARTATTPATTRAAAPSMRFGYSHVRGAEGDSNP